MNFLGRARQMLQGWGPAEPPRPQYFNVACAGGHRLHGERTEGYQALRCPTCGEGIFILPRSPLPDPPAPAPKARPRRVVEGPAAVDEGPIRLSDPPPMAGPPPAEEEADAAIEWLDPDPVPDAASVPPRDEAPIDFEPEPEAPPAPRPKPKRSPGRRPVAGGPTPRPPAAARSSIALVERPGLGEWIRGHRHLVLFLAVGLLVVATIGFRLRQRRWQELPRIAEIGRTEGLSALDAGDFDTARRKLSEAARAVQQLGGAFEGADTILKGAEEAAIFVDLVPTPLEEIVTEAARADDEKVWQEERFNTLYKGRSIILDGNVADYRILSRSGLKSNRVGRVDTTGFRLLESDGSSKEKDAGDFVFGARLDSITLEEGQWIVRLEPESGVVMTHWDALRAFGWPLKADASSGGPP